MIIRPTAFFRGGQPAGHKTPTEQLPPERIPTPAEVAVPLLQHAGKPALPVVEAGQAVKRGECIAVCAGGVSANVHASVAVTVTAIETPPDARAGWTDSDSHTAPQPP